MTDKAPPRKKRGPGRRTALDIVRAKDLFVRSKKQLPIEALIDLREGRSQCMLCDGKGLIDHATAKAFDKFYQLPEGVKTEEECLCTNCAGKGTLVLTPDGVEKVNSIMMQYTMPKLKQVETIETTGKKRVTRLTSIRDPKVLQQKIEQMHAIEEGTYDESDEVIEGELEES